MEPGQKLVLGTSAPSQSQSIQLHNALEMREQHFNLLAVFTRWLVSVGLGDSTSDIACRFMHASRNLGTGVFGQQRALIGLVMQSN